MLIWILENDGVLVLAGDLRHYWEDRVKGAHHEDTAPRSRPDPLLEGKGITLCRYRKTLTDASDTRQGPHLLSDRTVARRLNSK